MDTARAAAVNGPVYVIDIPDASELNGVDVSFDYRKFARGFGGDWASRLRIVELPACALTRPARAECQRQTNVFSRNDVDAKAVIARLNTAAPTPASVGSGGGKGPATATSSKSNGGVRVLALTAAAAGSSGSFAASSLSAVGSWSAGGSSGGFSWSTALEVPPSLGGPSPSIALGYSSSSVDGRMVSTNNQTSWVGEGWDYQPGFVERQYVACSDDQTGGNNTVKTGDLCWASDNVTLSLNGKSSAVVRDDATGAWKLETNDGSRVERLTATNGNSDNDGEYWKVTTTDGTQYFFGRHRLPGWASGKPQTDSVLTVPVYGNQSGEPCNQSTFATSVCDQAWRWNVDHVVDPHGNTMSYWYAKEKNYYGKNLLTAGAVYDRAGYLTRIDYGQRSGSEYSTSAPARVRFDVAERCGLPPSSFSCTDANFTAANAAQWPDTPVDQNCKQGEACTGRFTPTFWSRKRLLAVRTESLNAASGYDAVDKWALTHAFPNSGDGLSPALWLSTITRTGSAGGTKELPPITFKSTQLANRVDTGSDGTAALYRHRINEIYSETGAVTGITYSQPECTPASLPASDATNAKRCYPVFWTPPGASQDKKEYFHKYVVAQVLDQDRSAGQPAVEKNYTYLDGPAWAYDDSELVKPAKRTWNQFRGYAKVQTRTGAPAGPAPVMLSESRYFLGMNGDRNATGGTKTANVTDSDGVSVPDEPEFAGYERESLAYDAVGGTVVSSTINTPWRSPVQATRVRPGTTALTSRATAVSQVQTKTKLGDGTWRRAKVVKTFTNDGIELTVSDHGDLAVVGDESCTTQTYPPAGAAWIKQLPVQTVKVAKSCDVAPSLPADLLSDTRTFYDNATVLATAPNRGLATKVEYVDSWPAGGTAHVARQSNATYDEYGRVKTSTDPLGKVTSTAYTHTPAGGPVTKLAVTNPLSHVMTTEIDARRGVDKAIVDANGKRTEATYDPLGRVSKVWQPGRATTLPANVEYTYEVYSTKPTVIGTKALRNDGTYASSYEIYDGLMRLRQTQTPGAVSGRLLTDIFYDSRGLAVKSNDGWHNQNPPAAGLYLIDGTTTPDNIVPAQTVTEYDGQGRVTASILRGYGTEKWRTTTSYTGNSVSVDPPTGAPAVTEINDTQGRVVERRRYPSGAISGSYETTKYTYNPQGQMKTVVAPGNETWSYDYDLLGRMTKSVDPDTGSSTTTYDAAGRVQSTQNAEGQSVWTKYDDLGRVVSTHDESLSGTTRTSFVYDTVMKGYPTSSSRWDAGLEYKTAITGYDDGYRSKGTTYTIPASTANGALAGTYTFGRAFTLNGDLYRESFPAAGGLASDVLEYTYTQTARLARVKSVVNAEQYLDTVLYSEYGEPLRNTYGSTGKNVYVSYAYEDTTRRLTTQTLDRSITPTRLEARNYRYDNAGNIKAQVSTAAGVTDAQCYRYDGLARLTDAWTAKDDCAGAPSTGTTGTVGGPQPYWHAYTYDAFGNRKTETKKSPAGTVGGDTVRTFTYPTTATAQPHTLRSVATTGPAPLPAESYGWDKAGRQTTRTQANKSYVQSWDGEGKLVKSVQGSTTSTFLYDSAGTRLVKREPGTTTLYLNGSTELALNTSTGAVTGTRLINVGGAGAVKTAGATSFVIDDHQGTGQWIVDKTSLAASQRRLTAFGEDRAGMSNPVFPADKTFVGGTKDASTGLIHIGAREYNPSAGAFISADPIMDLRDPEQLNGYAYSKHSPVTYSDPDGLKPVGAGDDGTGYEWDGNSWEWDQESWDSSSEKAEQAEAARYSHAKTNKPQRPRGGPSEKDTRKAKEIKKKSIVDVIKEHGAQIILEVLGVNDAVSCFTKGDVGACVSMALGALPIGKILKAKKIGQALYRAFNGFMEFRQQLRWANRIEAEAAAAAAMPAGGNFIKGVDNVLESCLLSFSGDTPVVTGEGTTKPIKDVKPGDRVAAVDPESGRQQPSSGKVTHTWPHNDTLVTLQTSAGQVTTTEDHPFWNDTDAAWQQIQYFDRGDRLRTTDNRIVTVTGLDWASVHDGVAYNLTVDGLHTYFVGVGTQSVLVHNCSAAKSVDDLPTVNWGQQSKHFPGHPNFIPGRSTLTANPEALIQRAGTGTPVGSVPRGQPGFKERIDFGDGIGTYVSRDGTASPTSIGILHYRADGSVHIIPGRPQ